MPLYSYRCTACDHDFEALVGSSDVPACPACGSQSLQRLLSRPSAPGTSGEALKTVRKAAAKEGHFSNYSRSERSRI